MGASQVPAGSAQPNWVQLATATASGSTVSFTSLSEYRNYKVSFFNVTSTLGSAMYLTFNNDTGNNYAYLNVKDSGTIKSEALANKIEVAEQLTSSDGSSGIFTVLDANQVIKNIDYFTAKAGTGTESTNGEGFWNNTGVINRIDLSVSSTTFSGGTIKVYGCN